jgi:hypothetical protein
MKVINLAERAFRVTAPFVVGVSFAACGSTSHGVDGENGGTSSGYNPGTGGKAGYVNGGASNGGAISDSGVAPPTGDANCGVQTSGATKLPTDVLLVLDRSGSMSESIAADCCCASTCRNTTSAKMCSDTSNCTERWPALTTAVISTLTATNTINWGLKLYSSPSQSSSCGVNSGVEVAVGSGSATGIQSQISSVTPGGNTPTARAVSAATSYLQTVTDPNTKVILLATDGEPNCLGGSGSTSDVAGTTTAIGAALTAGYKVYVIGIGPSVGNLDNFAQAGGTDHYYPATSAADLATALAAISKAVSSCSFEMSQSPPDPSNLAVYMDGALVAKDSANGWSFGSNSQTVNLNGTACDKITTGAATNVQVLFGCPGQSPPQIL